MMHPAIQIMWSVRLNLITIKFGSDKHETESLFRMPKTTLVFSFPLILASSSPRRREILRNAGLRFRCVESNLEEGSPHRGESPRNYVLRLAREKARSVLMKVPPDAVLLAADTVVCMDHHILGKPRSRAEARRMLQLLSSRVHSVITGVVIWDCSNRRSYEWAERTTVRFHRLTEEEIDRYLETGEPFDKAGAYAAQGRAAKFIQEIRGCFFNVVGLPIAHVYQTLKKISRDRERRKGEFIHSKE